MGEGAGAGEKERHGYMIQGTSLTSEMSRTGHSTNCTTSSLQQQKPGELRQDTKTLVLMHDHIAGLVFAGEDGG